MTEFEKLFRLYFKDVYRYILRLSQNEQTAEDITAETFLKAMDKLDSFRGDCDIRVWLCQIAKNAYLSFLRRENRLTDLENLPEMADSRDLEALADDSETSMRLHECLHSLAEPYREVFSLRVFGELSFKQIAHLFGKTENWACVTYHRAKKQIQKRMEEYE